MLKLDTDARSVNSTFVLMSKGITSESGIRPNLIICGDILNLEVQSQNPSSCLFLHSYSMPRKKWWSRKSKSSIPGYKKSPNRQQKRKQWNEAQMLSAIETAMSGVSANQATRQHGVPPSTLKDRLSGRVLHGAKPGPRPHLGPNEEKELSEYLITSAKVGFGKTRTQVKCIAESVAKEKGMLKGERISNGWWWRFLERNPTISLRSGDSTAQV